jgi:hypothetical protein
VNGAWPENDKDAQAAELIRRAARLDIGPPASAKARVWQALGEGRRREHERPSRRRLGWAMFAAGAACAAAIAVMLAPRVQHQAQFTIASSAEPALIDLDGDGRIVAGPATRARLSRQDGAITLTLERGSLLAHVRPRSGKPPFIIKTAQLSARVVGTVLRVTAHEDGSSSIAVGHGAVEVTPNGQPARMVRTGQRWPTTSTDAPAAGELERMGALDLEGVDATALSPLPAPAAPASVPCDKRPGDDAVQCWLAVAEHAKDPTQAESALYQAGFLRMHLMRDPAFALGIWERQRARFPGGVLADEAQTSIIDALVALSRTRAAEAEIADYLKAHPRGLRSAEMHFVRGTLMMAEDHGCRRAAHELDTALAHPAAPWAARARAARAACR